MAADRATVSVSASLLPDEIKAAVGGTITYDINDLGSANKWAYSLTIIGNADEDALLPTVAYLGQGTTEEGGTPSVAANDDVVFFFIKHTGTTNGTTPSTDKLFLHLDGEDPAGGGAAGDIIIGPNECFFAKLSQTPMSSINVEADGSDNIQAMVFVIAEDGGF